MKKTTLPLFLALWAVMMLILGALNVEKQEIMLEGVMETARQDVERDYQEIWSGGAAEIQKPAILVGRRGNALYEYGGAACFRFYDAEGREVDRSQMTQGMTCPPGTGVYSWQIRFDPALTRQEQVELAKKIERGPVMGLVYRHRGRLAHRGGNAGALLRSDRRGRCGAGDHLSQNRALCLR